MGRKIEDYTNNVSANPDLNSVTDLSEKLGSTYESRKWTLADFITWLNANITTNSSFEFANNTGATINKGQLVVLNGQSGGNPSISKYTNSADVNNHSIIYIASEDVLNGAVGTFIKEGVLVLSTLTGNLGDKVYYSTSTLTLTTTNNAQDSIFCGVIIASSGSNRSVFFAPDKDPGTLYASASNQIALFIDEKKAQGNVNFTYVNTVGTEVGFRFTDAPNNNLTQVGIGYLNVETEGLSSNSATRLANWSDGSNKGILSFRKARGTKATPTQVYQDDVLGHIIYTGQHNFGAGTTTAIIEVVAKVNYDVNLNPITSNYERDALTEYRIFLAPSFSESGILGGFPNNLVFSVNGDGKVSFKNYIFPILDGTANQVLKTDGFGNLSWSTIASGLAGSGTLNKLAKFTPDGTTLGDSKISEDGTSVVFRNSGDTADIFTLNLSTGQTNIVNSNNNYINYNPSSSTYTLSNETNMFSFTLRNVSDSFWQHLRFIRLRADGSQPLSGDKLGSIGHLGHYNFVIEATENHNSTSQFYGKQIVIGGTQNGQNVALRTLILTQDNKVKISDVYYLPNTDGTNGQVLVTDGAGNVSWGTGSGASAFIPDLLGHETFRGVNYSNNSTTEVTNGGITMSTSASGVARSVASTNYATKIIRKGFTASVVSTGRYTGTRGSALLWYVQGGFKYVCDFYISDTAFGSGCRQFYGMAGQTTDLGYTDTILVSSLLNVIGVGSDSADANLQIFHNDGAGTCTKIDLGASFPSNRTAGAGMTTMYSIQIYNAPNSTSVKIQVTNKETGAVSQNTITTNLPLDTQGLNFFASRTMGAPLTNTGQFDLALLGVYSI